MFVENLNAEQQGILLALANQIMQASGEVLEDERQMMRYLELECDKGVEKSANPMSGISGAFPEKEQKISLILELMGMALADDTYQEEENHIIENVAESLSIDLRLLEDIKNWVRRQLILMNEVRILMEG